MCRIKNGLSCELSYLVRLVILLAVSSVTLSVRMENLGPLVKMTRGQVWPKPMIQHSYGEYLKIEPNRFRFKVTGYNCDNLQAAFKRYNGMLFPVTTKQRIRSENPFADIVVGTLEQLNVKMANPCEDYPSLDMDEKYEIEIKNSSGILLASSIWGTLRGLETFSQLITLGMDGSMFTIGRTFIADMPRFRHRGYLLDTSRHYFPIRTILSTLDAMSYSKMNAFHWHIVDDNSFPFQSSAFPNLSEKGAYGRSAIYTENEVKLVIEHARLRGIRVIPEFDTPGHTLSWGPGSIPGMLTPCSDSDPDLFGPIDPTIEDNYDFVETLLAEVNGLFRDRYTHVGGDEIQTTCWSGNKRIQEFMRRNDMHDVKELENYYFRRIFNVTRQSNKVPIVWEEVFDDNVRLDPDVVVQVWKNDFNATVQKLLKSGHPVLLSSCWYLNYVKFGSDWLDFYRCNPKTIMSGQNQNLFLGGEACMWGEFADETNVLPISWPRASAVAEVLWSHSTNETEAAHRLEEHVCRMRRRGIPAQPASGPNYCLL